VHVLTDIVADEMYYEEGIYEDIIKERTTEEKAFKFFKDQIQIYEKSQLNEQWWKDVANKLNNAKAYKINNIPEQEIYEWKNKILDEYSKKEYMPYDYVTPNIVNICYEKVIKILQENEIIL
jgi:hypothetical protein